MFEVDSFGLKEMTACGAALRKIGAGAGSMEEVAQRIVRYLYDNLVNASTGEPACIFARLFKSHPYAELDKELQHWVTNLLGDKPPRQSMKCFTLLASAGMIPGLNSRHPCDIPEISPINLVAVPLIPSLLLERIPAIAQVIRQLGLENSMSIEPDPSFVMDMDLKTFNVVYEAEPVRYTPAPYWDNFVIPFGMRTAFGMAGMLPSGNFFFVPLFFNVFVSRETAEIFKPLALSIKQALLPFDDGVVFDSDKTRRHKQAVVKSKIAGQVNRRLESQVFALNELLEVHEKAVLERTSLLEQAIKDLDERAVELQKTERELSAALETNRQQMLELDRSNLELQQFASVASHDLQEPLRAVSGYLDLLSRQYEDKLDQNAVTFIHHARDGAMRMNALIRALLDYARIDTRGKEFSSTDCNNVLNDALSNLKVAIEESNTEIVRSDMPTIMGDRIQLTQLFQNLIGNAVKFRGEETPRVEIGASRNGHEWQLFVRDNGIGLDMAYADRIFVIFKRLHTRTAYAGTGIGLSICKKIVERHGGDIWIESAPGAGSTFFFTFPVREYGDA